MSVDEIWLKYERDVKEEMLAATAMAATAAPITAPIDAVTAATTTTSATTATAAVVGTSSCPPKYDAENTGIEAGEADDSTAATASDASSKRSQAVVAPLINEDELYRHLYQKILRKSCSTNSLVDYFAAPGLSPSFPSSSPILFIVIIHYLFLFHRALFLVTATAVFSGAAPLIATTTTVAGSLREDIRRSLG